LKFVVDSNRRFFLMVLVTLAAGLVLSVLMAIGGSYLLRDGAGGWGGLVGGIAGMVIGYPLGVMAGVVLARYLLKYCGSLWTGLVGALVPGFLILGLIEPLNLNQNPNLMLSIFFLVSPLMATFGFHLRLGRARAG